MNTWVRVIRFKSLTGLLPVYILYRKYERLQSEVDKSNDKSSELSALEKELNAKEEEIKTIIGLYKEVRAIIEHVTHFAGMHILFSTISRKNR